MLLYSTVDSEVIPTQMNYTIIISKRPNGWIWKWFQKEHNQFSSRSPSIMWSLMGEVKILEMQRSVSWRFLQATCLWSIVTRTIKQLMRSLSKLTTYTNNHIIWLSGNFHSSDIECQTLAFPPGSANLHCQQLLLDITQDHNLSHTVSHPTCLHNILHQFFTNFPVLIKNIQVIP